MINRILLLCCLLFGSLNGWAQNSYPATGNVGINLGGSGSLNSLQIGPNPSGWSGNDLVVTNSQGGFAFFTGATESYIWGSKPISIRPNGTQALWAQPDGRVGIGTISPQHRLDVAGAVRTSSFFYLTNVGTTGNQGISADDAFGSTVFSITRQPNNETRFQSFGYHTFFSGGSSGSEKMRITESGSVGIGTSNPAARLSIRANTQSQGLIVANCDTQGYQTHLGFTTADQGRIGLAPESYLNLYNNGRWNFNSGNTSAQTQPISFSTDDLVRMTIATNGNIGIGTTNPQQKLHVKGTVYSTEVKVDVAAGTGPDYVFAANYQLPTLDYIKSYIAQHQHLPEVPSAKEMEANGVNLGEMNLLLLKKIEELTLFVIQQREIIGSLEKEVKQLKESKK
jgi:hypothetical protein